MAGESHLVQIPGGAVLVVRQCTMINQVASPVILVLVNIASSVILTGQIKQATTSFVQVIVVNISMTKGYWGFLCKYHLNILV